MNKEECNFSYKMYLDNYIYKDTDIINPSLICNIYDCLKEDYKYLSPIKGYMLYQSGKIKKLYNYETKLAEFLQYIFMYDENKGFPITISISVKNVLIENISPYYIGILISYLEKIKYTNISQKKFTDELNELFYKNTSLNDYVEDYKKIKQIKNLCNKIYKKEGEDKILSVNLSEIKKLCSIINRFITKYFPEFKEVKCENIIIIDNNVSDNICTLDNNHKLLQILDILYKGFIKSLKESVIKNLYTDDMFILGSIDEPEFIQLFNNIKKEYDRYLEDNDCTFEFIRKKKASSIDLFKLLYNALDEINFFEKKKEIKDIYIIYDIFYVILHLKCRTNDDYSEYFRALKENIGKEIFKKEYEKGNYIFQRKEFDIKLLNTNFEKFIYETLMYKYYNTSPLFYFNNKIKYKYHKITDCNEIIIINLLNLYLYDKNTLSFDINKLFKLNKLNTSKIDKKLLQFYIKHNIYTLNSKEYHRDIVDLFSSIDTFTYTNAIRKDIEKSIMGTTDNLFNFRYTEEILTEDDYIMIKDFKLEYVKKVNYGDYEIIYVNKDKYYLCDLSYNINLFVQIFNKLLYLNKESIFEILKLLELNVKNEFIDETPEEYFDNKGIVFTKDNVTYSLKIHNKKINGHNSLNITTYDFMEEYKIQIKKEINLFMKNKEEDKEENIEDIEEDIAEKIDTPEKLNIYNNLNYFFDLI